jgi:hypothetical protein
MVRKPPWRLIVEPGSSMSGQQRRPGGQGGARGHGQRREVQQRGDGREGDRSGQRVIPALHDGSPFSGGWLLAILGVVRRDLPEARRLDFRLWD